MNKDTIEIYTDFIDNEGYVQRYNYETQNYYNTGICLKGAKGNPGNPGRPGKNGDSWDLKQVDGIYYWFKNGINTQIPAQYKNDESVPANLAKVASTGNYNDLLNKPEIPVVPTNVSDFNNDAGYLTQHQDISGKEDAMSIVNVPAGTATLSTEVGNYYTFADAVETMNITLPSPTDVTKVRSIVFYLTTGVTPSITFNSAVPVYYHNGFQLEAVKTYEVNALFNGIAWVVTVVEIFVPVTVVAKYNVTSTSEPTTLRTNQEQNIFKSMEIDGVLLDELVTEYTFDTTGVHTVKYELYDETKLGNNGPIFNSGNLVECIIPNTVTNIGIAAFVGCRGLTNITIPNSVTAISNFAFQGCTGLTSIVIGSGTETIGQGAFQGCTNLTSITIPDSVTSIGATAFANIDALKVLNYNAKCELNSSFRGSWPNLETVIIGDSTPSIGSQAFIGCSSLINVTIGNSVTSIGTGAFSNCGSLTSIDIPDGVTSIGTEAFYSCSGLTNVIIGNGVTSINQSAFMNCSGLTSINIPDSVTNIDMASFMNCSGLTSIISNAMTAPTISNYTFKNIKTGGTLTVPVGSTGYDVWMGTSDYYLGKYNWTKVEQ